MSLFETIKCRLLGVALFSFGPFYFFPPKLPLNRFFGCNFETAYYHFRQNHRNALNLALHFVCFFVQIFGNFSLLKQLDDRYIQQRVPGVRQLSAISAATWSFAQLTSGAGILPSLISSACIVSAYFVVPHLTPHLFDCGVIGTFLTVLTVTKMITGIGKQSEMIRAYLVLPLILAATQYASENHFGFAKDKSKEILVASLVYLVSLPILLRNPLKPIVVTGSILLRIAYIASGEPVLFWLSYGLMASMLQGVTHLCSEEEATLIALERKGQMEKIAFEYGHVVHFPNLAIKTLLDTFAGIPPPSKNPEKHKDDEGETKSARGSKKDD